MRVAWPNSSSPLPGRVRVAPGMTFPRAPRSTAAKAIQSSSGLCQPLQQLDDRFIPGSGAVEVGLPDVHQSLAHRLPTPLPDPERIGVGYVLRCNPADGFSRGEEDHRMREARRPPPAELSGLLVEER